MARKKSKNPAKKSRLTMPDPRVVLSTWIQERVEHVAKTRWSDELTEWAKCAWYHAHPHPIMSKAGPVSNHLNEPPIPVVIGFIAEAASNHMQGSHPAKPTDRRKLERHGKRIAEDMHRKPQKYMTNTACPLLPYPIPDPIRSKKKAGQAKRRK